MAVKSEKHLFLF